MSGKIRSLEKIRQKLMLFNIIGASPEKSVAPSEKVEKVSGNLDDIKDPVVMICQKDLYNKKEKENNKKYNLQG